MFESVVRPPLGLGQLGEDAGLAFLPQPVALAADVDRRREVQQPVQDGGRQDLVGKDVAPVAVGLVRGQDDRAAAVAAADELEQELGGHAVEREVAHLVQDQQLGPAEGVQAVVKAVLLGVPVELSSRSTMVVK